MRKSAVIAGLVLCASVFVATAPQVHAEAPQKVVVGNSSSISDGQKVLAVVNAQLSPPETPAPEEKPVEHIVAEGETLTKVADKYQTTWQRLYAKNTNISNPDVIDVGEKLVVPKSDEQLAERAAPVEPARAPAVTTSRAKSPSQPKPATKQTASRGSSSGNTYTQGYCTWYAKSKRPDMPNNLGNASTWVSRAAGQGMATGSAPRTGAIGQRGNHVVYVESVNGDGSVNVSEMNHKGVGIVSSRTVPGDYFSYIY